MKQTRYDLITYAVNMVRFRKLFTMAFSELTYMAFMKNANAAILKSYMRKEDLSPSSYDEILLTSFSWAATPEGIAFWSDINSKWTKFIQEMDYC